MLKGIGISVEFIKKVELKMTVVREGQSDKRYDMNWDTWS